MSYFQCCTLYSLLAAFLRGVVDHTYIFQRNQPPAACLFKKVGQCVQKCIHFGFLVHYLDNNGKVRRQIQDFCSTNSCRRPVSQYALQDGGASQSRITRLFDDGLIQWQTPEPVTFTDKNPQ